MPETIGFFGGKFTPIHNGHVHSMIQASTMVDELHIIVCYDEQSEKEELYKDSSIPYIHHSQRARWWKEITKDMANVFVHTIYNKNTMDISDWEEGALAIKEAIGKPITHVFSSDKSYDEFFSKLYPESTHCILDFKRTRHPISATQIRKEGVMRHWHHLPKFVQRYFVKKVVVVGSESCGKSTLVRNLATLYNTVFVEEHGRAYFEELGDFETFYREDFNKIAFRQKYFEEEGLKHANKVIFYDTEAIVTLRFLVEYKGGDSELLRQIANEQQYDLWLFLEDDVVFVDDGTRGYVNDRNKSTHLLKQLLKEHCVPYISIKGSYSERLLSALKEVDKLIQ